MNGTRWLITGGARSGKSAFAERRAADGGALADAAQPDPTTPPAPPQFDKDGKIAAIHTGLVSKATYQKQLESLLTEGAHARSGSDAREYAFFRARE